MAGAEVNAFRLFRFDQRKAAQPDLKLARLEDSSILIAAPDRFSQEGRKFRRMGGNSAPLFLL